MAIEDEKDFLVSYFGQSDKDQKMLNRKHLPFGLAFLAASFSACAGFLASLSARADSASVRLDVYAAQPDNPAAKQQFNATKAMLLPPRDPRLWELEALRLQRLDQAGSIEASRNALAVAVKLAPARTSLRMQHAYELVSTQDLSKLSKRISDWHDVAPHDGETQPWRLALGVAHWDTISPQVRAKLLDDAEDMCVRSGDRRTLDLVRRYGQDIAQLAVSSRLSRMTRPCVNYPIGAPPIIQ